MIKKLWLFYCGAKDTRTNNEDFVITPYISFVWADYAIGLALTFGFWSIFLAIKIKKQ